MKKPHVNVRLKINKVRTTERLLKKIGEIKYKIQKIPKYEKIIEQNWGKDVI